MGSLFVQKENTDSCLLAGLGKVDGTEGIATEPVACIQPDLGETYCELIKVISPNSSTREFTSTD